MRPVVGSSSQLAVPSDVSAAGSGSYLHHISLSNKKTTAHTDIEATGLAAPRQRRRRDEAGSSEAVPFAAPEAPKEVAVFSSDPRLKSNTVFEAGVTYTNGNIVEGRVSYQGTAEAPLVLTVRAAGDAVTVLDGLDAKHCHIVVEAGAHFVLRNSRLSYVSIEIAENATVEMRGVRITDHNERGVFCAVSGAQGFVRMVDCVWGFSKTVPKTHQDDRCLVHASKGARVEIQRCTVKQIPGFSKTTPHVLCQAHGAHVLIDSVVWPEAHTLLNALGGTNAVVQHCTHTYSFSRPLLSSDDEGTRVNIKECTWSHTGYEESFWGVFSGFSEVFIEHCLIKEAFLHVSKHAKVFCDHTEFSVNPIFHAQSGSQFRLNQCLVDSSSNCLTIEGPETKALLQDTCFKSYRLDDPESSNGALLETQRVVECIDGSPARFSKDLLTDKKPLVFDLLKKDASYRWSRCLSRYPGFTVFERYAYWCIKHNQGNFLFEMLAKEPVEYQALFIKRFLKTFCDVLSMGNMSTGGPVGRFSTELETYMRSTSSAIWSMLAPALLDQLHLYGSDIKKHWLAVLLKTAEYRSVYNTSYENSSGISSPETTWTEAETLRRIHAKKEGIPFIPRKGNSLVSALDAWREKHPHEPFVVYPGRYTFSSGETLNLDDIQMTGICYQGHFSFLAPTFTTSDESPLRITHSGDRSSSMKNIHFLTPVHIDSTTEGPNPLTIIECTFDSEQTTSMLQIRNTRVVILNTTVKNTRYGTDAPLIVLKGKDSFAQLHGCLLLGNGGTAIASDVPERTGFYRLTHSGQRLAHPSPAESLYDNTYDALYEERHIRSTATFFENALLHFGYIVESSEIPFLLTIDPRTKDGLIRFCISKNKHALALKIIQGSETTERYSLRTLILDAMNHPDAEDHRFNIPLFWDRFHEDLCDAAWDFCYGTEDALHTPNKPALLTEWMHSSGASDEQIQHVVLLLARRHLAEGNTRAFKLLERTELRRVFNKKICAGDVALGKLHRALQENEDTHTEWELTDKAVWEESFGDWLGTGPLPHTLSASLRAHFGVSQPTQRGPTLDRLLDFMGGLKLPKETRLDAHYAAIECVFRGITPTRSPVFSEGEHTCLACFESKSAHSFWTNPCEHHGAMCRDCAHTWVSTFAEEGRTTHAPIHVACADQNPACDPFITRADIETLFPEATQAPLRREFYMRSWGFVMNAIEGWTSFHAACGLGRTHAHISASTAPYMACGACDEAHEIKHQPTPREEVVVALQSFLDGSDPEEGSSRPAPVRYCRSCSTKICRNDGCLHMTCKTSNGGGCKGEFWWNKGQYPDGTGYAHYPPPPSHPHVQLWRGLQPTPIDFLFEGLDIPYGAVIPEPLLPEVIRRAQTTLAELNPQPPPSVS